MLWRWKGGNAAPSHRGLRHFGKGCRNGVRLHVIGQRQSEDHVCEHDDNGKGRDSESPEWGFILHAIGVFTVTISYGYRPVRQPGVRRREWRASRLE